MQSVIDPARTDAHGVKYCGGGVAACGDALGASVAAGALVDSGVALAVVSGVAAATVGGVVAVGTALVPAGEQAAAARTSAIHGARFT